MRWRAASRPRTPRSAKDAKIDKVEAQMVDSYDNEKKVAVLSRIQACSFFGEFLQK